MSSGSMGFTLFTQPTLVTVEKAEKDEIIGISAAIQNKIVKHLGLLRSTIQEDTAQQYLKIIVALPQEFRHHTGLGLTTQITGAAILAAGEIYGKSLSPKDVFNLGIGQVSALGLSLLYNPGFLLEFGYKVDETNNVSAHPKLYEHNESPTGSLLEVQGLPWSAVVAIPKEITSLSGKMEDAFWNKIFPDNVESSQQISYAVLTYIIPAVMSNDFDNFIKGLALATRTGTKPAEESIQDIATQQMLQEMRDVFGFAAVSSLGPALFSFVKNIEFESLSRQIDNKNFDLYRIPLTNPDSSLEMSIPSKVIKNNNLKYFFEDKNIPFEALSNEMKSDLIQILQQNQTKKKSKIIVSFACLGKTYFAGRYPERAIDLESLPFRFKTDSTSEEAKSDVRLEHNDAFPGNYAAEIVKNIGKYEYIFVVLSIPVLKMLDELHIEYTVLYPDISMLDVIIERSRQRGNNDAMIKLLYDNLTSTTEIDLMKNILDCKDYVFMKGNEYIENLIEKGII